VDLDCNQAGQKLSTFEDFQLGDRRAPIVRRYASTSGSTRRRVSLPAIEPNRNLVNPTSKHRHAAD
jgi:hypothetical protein